MSGGWAAELVEPTPAEVEQSAQRFGRYLLCWELASGGMGTVYLARELGPAGFDRPVAIKRIHPHLRKHTHLVDMFLDEARITSRINHPNVCSVFDFGEVTPEEGGDGTYYIALEYLLGESVGGVIAHVLENPAELDSPTWHAMTARIIGQAAEGLHAAHNVSDASGKPMHVVHRDVSPPNLFVTYDGAVKVLDFGVARAEGRLHTTNAGVVKGKLAYMAPEQVGEKELDGRADVWSLGVCAWEMLTGERLFRAKNEMDTILAVKSKTILRPAEMRASVPAELDAIVMRALRRDPAERFASARELSRALETFLRGCEQPTGLADVAEWMDARFRTRRERKNEMVETVLRSAERSGHRISTARAGDATPSLKGAGPTREGAATAEVAEVAEAAPSSKTPAWKRAVPVVALLVGIAGTLLVTRGGESGSRDRDRNQEQSQEQNQHQTQMQTQIAVPDPSPSDPAPESASSDTVPHEAADLEFELEPLVTEMTEMTERTERTEMTTMRVARAPGRVNVVTPGGWADVYFRRRRIGRTPGSFELPAGSQRLELRPFGSGSVRVTVFVRSDETVRLSRPVSR